ncbi:MAG: IMP dehydrogenase [Candidatus Shapirobacteria bacterium]
MKYIYEESRTFNEFLLTPGLTASFCTIDKIDLKTHLTKYRPDHPTLKGMELNIPVTSAIMQSVSDDRMATTLAKEGGLSFIYCSQSIEDQCEMVRRAKKAKAGFVASDSNIKATDTLETIIRLKDSNGHSTMAVTHNGKSTGKLLGLVTSRDYRIGKTPSNTKVSEFMTPIDKLVYAKDGTTLTEANDLIWEHKLNCLPIVSKKGNLKSLVFRKDYEQHANNRNELLDEKKAYLIGAGVNTKDYKERIPALIKAGVDILCIDSSDGYSDFVKNVLTFVKSNYLNVPIGAGNIVNAEAFLYLAKAGADFIKVGIGGGSICITREQKGIGAGQATAVMEIAKARDEYLEKTGVYVPICSDGGIVTDTDVTMALAMGADFVMMGRYFAGCDESPGKKVTVNGNVMKEYWGEGSNHARNWQRYDSGGQNSLKFEEGVDSFVPYTGSVKEKIEVLTAKIKSTMSSCGCSDIPTFHKKVIIRPVSGLTLREGSAHDVTLKE